MTLLIVLGTLVTYLLVGVLYARSQYLRLWQQQHDKHCDTDHKSYQSKLNAKFATSDAKAMCAWRIPFWPYAMVFDAVKQPIARWFTKPLADRQEYAEQLRADAKAWEAKRGTGTDAERRMAAELARICRERADEVQP